MTINSKYPGKFQNFNDALWSYSLWGVPMYYEGTVTYGCPHWPSRSVWLVPGVVGT